VNITNAGPQGGSSRIVIRGERSLTGENQPLFVIDGVPVDNYTGTSGILASQGGYDYGTPVQDLNPDAIESLTVLKGPNAAALYGSRAANGAVIITTKKGRGATGGAQINAEQLVTWETPLRLPEYQNQYGQGYYGLFSYYDGKGNGVFDEVDESWGPPLDQGLMIPQYNSPIVDGVRQPTPWVSHPDNVRDFFETGQTRTTNVSVAAANERLNGRLGFSNLSLDGMLPGMELSRQTLTFGGGIDATSKLNVSTSMQYTHADGEHRPATGYTEDNPMSQFVWFGRQVDVNDLERNYATVRPPEDPMAGLPYSWNYSFHPNPYYLQLVNRNEDTRNRLIGQVSAAYEFTPWLNAMVRSGTDWYQDYRQKNFAQDNFGGLYTTNPLNDAREPVAPTGAFGEWNMGFRETNTDFLVTANPDLHLPFTVNATFGGNRRDWQRNHHYVWVGELSTPGIFNVDNAAVAPKPFDRVYRKRVNSLYGQAELGYNDYLFLTVTGRNDWSSTLPAENNSYFYPSVSGSFVFSDAIPALQSGGPLTYGKLRASWARVGSDTSPYQLLNTYFADDKYGTLPTFTLPGQLNNPELRPESTESWEVGTELALFDDRLGLDLTYYDATTRDQIMPLDVSYASGYSSRLLNAGSVRNRGWEALARLTPIQTDRFRWETTATWSRNENTVTELAEGVNGLQISLQDLWGAQVFARKGEPYGQLVGRGFQRNSEGQIIVSSTTGLPLPTSEPIPLGNFNPDWRAGWANDFSFGPARLHVLLDAKKGGSVYSITQMFGGYAGVLEETAKGRCLAQSRIDALAENGLDTPYPACNASTGLIVDGVRIASIDGSDTTFVKNDIPVSATDYYERLFLIPEGSVVDASYLKLRELTLSFDVPSRFLRSARISGAQISLIGRNLFLWTPASNRHIDPETGPDANNVQGIEYGQVPSARSIGFNISVRP
jgi:TonB-linked SusC/RagA family outer membrane protein